MTTPTTMTTSMITTATTMMTGAVVAPSLGGLLVGCMLLLTGTVVVIVLSCLVGCMLHMTGTVVVSTPTVWGGVVSSGIDAVERKHTT